MFLLEQCRSSVRHGLDRARSALARWIPRFRPHFVVEPHDAAHAMTSTVATLTAEGVVSNAGASLERQMELLSARFELLFKEFRDIRASVDDVWRALGQRLSDLEGGLLVEVADRKDAVASAESRSLEADARALPVIGLGVLLTGLADEIGCFWLWAWLVVVPGAIIVALLIAWSVRRDDGSRTTRAS